MTRKSFTVDGANALVPALNKAFRAIRAHRHAIREASARLDVLELLWGGALREPSNPDHGEFLRRREEMERALRGIHRVVEEEIVAHGLRFPTGGLENGLVDFPTTYRGRWVYLCWQVGEREIRYWHEIDAGFQGRREITTDDRRAMGADDPASIDDSELDC